MPKTSSKKKPREAKQETQVAAVFDGVGDVNVLLNMAGGKVASVVFPLDKGDRVTIPAALLRSTVEMINESDADNG